MSVASYNKVTINLGHLRQNYQNLSRLAGESVTLLPMIKSEAYGHGLAHCAQALAEAGAVCFGVAEIDEGALLRKAGILGDIIVFLGTSQYDALVDYRLAPVVFDRQQIEGIAACAAQRQTTVGVHLKVDVGMGRLGVMPDEVLEFVQLIQARKGVCLAGLISHFPMADQCEYGEITKAQIDRFSTIVQGLACRAQDSCSGMCKKHIANSAAMICYPSARFDMARPGIALYGCYPSDDKEFARRVKLKPVMSFSTRIVQIKEVPAGYGISYGHLFVTKKASRLAVLPVGYADGYLRCLTNKAQVLIGGQRAPVCGRICMNASVVDITDIDGGQVGDEVVLMGSQEQGSNEGEISAEEIASWMETINYEVLCLFGNNNQRVYVG